MRPICSRMALVVVLAAALAAPALGQSEALLQAAQDQVSRIHAARWVCGPLLDDSARFVRTLLDPFTGLPYDQLRCNCRWQTSKGVCQSSGVLPQLPDADVIPFAEDGDGLAQALEWGFVDALPAGEGPTLFHALELALHLGPGNQFGGLIWGARADISRYDRLRVRYRTMTPSSAFELKLNSGLPGEVREITVMLSGTPADGSWVERTFRVADDFPGTDAAHLNFVVFATSLGVAGETDPVLWVDHLTFLADPERMADCDVTIDCDGDCYPDLARYEPQTGAVNVANAVSSLSLLAEAGRMDRDEARSAVEKILDSLAATPRTGGFIQDWHSPASLMPHPTNRVGSTTDLPQLVASLMVAEVAWPGLAGEIAELREGLADFSALFVSQPQGACPGELRWARDACDGLLQGRLEVFGNDTLLGEFLAIATGGAPAAFWSQCLSRKGCVRRGATPHRWYTTGAFACAEHEIPAAETGGPFLQLAGLTYLDADRLPVGSETLAESARAMLLAQAEYAETHGLEVWGWANHADSDSCDYLTCESFAGERATPYVCAMGLDLGVDCALNLWRFHQAGADAPFDTGTVVHALGLRDAWNQATGSSREDAFLYLDTGWSLLGLLNACHGELVRQTFAAHPLAESGYAALAGEPVPCP